ncbi:hypothetical protein ACERII_20345 [Evansella sp. AB-rgal1]|uniref:hypothetical protein n=1 Tax=Evansella sp. AB-rgal1 TaxID=3242696 RepID=UPI00359D22B0
MEEKSLINELKHLKELIAEKEVLEKKRDAKYQRSIRGMEKIFMIIISIFLFIYGIFHLIGDRSFSEPAQFIVPIALAVVIVVYYWLSNSYSRKHQKIDETQLNKLAESIHQIHIVPEFYQNTTSLDAFISFLETGRASSIDKCIEIIEIEDKAKKIVEREKNLVRKEMELHEREKEVTIKEELIEPLHQEAESKLTSLQHREQLLDFNETLLLEIKETNGNFQKYNTVLQESTTQLSELDFALIEKKLDQLERKVDDFKWDHERLLDEYSRNQSRLFDDFRRDMQA